MLAVTPIPRHHELGIQCFQTAGQEREESRSSSASRGPTLTQNSSQRCRLGGGVLSLQSMGTDSGSWLSPELGVDVHAQLELEG